MTESSLTSKVPWIAGLALVSFSACAGGSTGESAPAEDVTSRAAGEEKMILTSSAFSHETNIPTVHTCDDRDDSPALSWGDVPGKTASFALIMDDPDAPPGTWVHWILYDLPSDRRELAESLAKTERPEGGGVHGACWGVDNFDRVGYHGPCPPPGPPHRYYFKLYALDSTLNLAPGATKSEVMAAMEGHVLAEAVLMGRYQR